MMLHRHQPRRGAVLITVMVVIVVLLLIAYQYLNLMNAESNASVVSGRLAQSRALADSGVHYAAFSLAFPQTVGLSDSPDSYRVWSGNIYDNSEVFSNRPINGPNGVKGYFSIVSPRDPMDTANSTGYRYGVEDENGKVNLNAIRALIKKDPNARALIETLIKAIPNMNEEQALAVINWTEEGGSSDSAESSYYSGLGYQSKGGPYDTTDELLLVKGWTPKQLYGNDKNRNGRLDPDEDDGSGAVDLGMQRYFTVFSRELNVDSTGQQRINLGNSNLQDLKTQLDTAVGTELANFILLMRASSGIPKPAALATLELVTAPSLPAGFTYEDNKLVVDATKVTANSRFDVKTASLWDLVNTSYAYQVRVGGRTRPTLLNSPLQSANKETLRTTLTALLDKCSMSADLEIPARININSCPPDILTAMGINEADTEKLLSYRPTPDMDPNTIAYYKTPAWLVTEADMNPTVIKAFSQFITTYSQVFRFQVVGYYEYRGPQVRLEVVVDANNGRPRILHWRDLTDLGKGYHFSQGRGSNTSFRGPSEMLNRRWN
jgi:hypothetical protein